MSAVRVGGSARAPRALEGVRDLCVAARVVGPAAAGWTAAVRPVRPTVARRAEPHAAASLVARVDGAARDAAPLASAVGRQTLDVPGPSHRSNADRRRGAR